MKFDEFMKIVKVLKSAYTGDNFLPDADAVKVWYHSLKDIPYELLQIASYQYITTHKFPPTISELRSTAVKVTTEDTGWSKGWSEVLKTIRLFGIYDEKNALDNMDKITRETVERIGYKNICLSENLGVERANFRMIYEMLAQVHQESSIIPLTIKAKIEEMITPQLESK